MNRRRGILLYGLAAILFAAEMTIFGISLFPNVDSAYRAFYISRSTDCYPLPVTGTYEPGRRVSFGMDDQARRLALARCGWREPAADGSWTDGQLSMLRFRIGDIATDMVLELDLRPYIDGAQIDQRVEITANGMPLVPLHLDSPQRVQREVLIPAAALASGAGLLDLEFHMIGARSPYELDLSPTDKRIYGLYVYSLRLAAVQ